MAKISGFRSHSLTTLEADVDGLLAVLEAAVPPLRFELKPDTAHLTDELLEELAGTYALGPISAVIARRGDQDLVISIQGGAPTALTPVRGRVFSLSGAPLDFAGEGRLVTPMGEFIKSSSWPCEPTTVAHAR